MTSTEVPAGVTVRLPNGWVEIDPRAADIAAELVRTARDVWGDRFDEALLRNAAVPVALELRRMAAGTDLLLAGAWAEAIGDGTTGTPLVLTASAVLAVSPPIAGLPAIRASLEREGLASLEVTSVDLPSGPALLASAVVRIDRPEWTESVPALLRRYFIPLPGTERVAVLSFTTPNTDLATEFGEVFAAVAESVRFQRATSGT
ncbi:hypothetical protein [Umezawaea sp. NPDC059074]|uniref:hypothetical protein n=1 Tax=Umezawaea sp. NPDC059074 TaxID=3346716 RepID=UPI003692566A